MQFPTIFRILGLLLMIFSLSTLPPILIAGYYQDGAEGAFVFSLILTMLTGLALWLRFKKFRHQLRTRDGFFIVGFFWIVLCLYGALPFWLSAHPSISFSVAVFESVSGLTTAGAVILPDLGHLPHAILFYRQELQFLGGMGVIVLAVAILPMLNIGGMQLYRAEMTGPLRENKLTPRITETAKALWFIYIGLNVACAVSYWLAGMGGFDAVCTAFSTISTGGFSPHAQNLSFYHSNAINSVAIVFMLLGAMNFGLHFLAIKTASLLPYWRNTEFRSFIVIVLSCLVICIIVLALGNFYTSFGDLILKPLFTVTSFLTTTGFTTTEYLHWPASLIFLLMLLSLVGACSGSTAGGIKVLRLILWVKQSGREVFRLIHPKAIYEIKFGHQMLSDRVINSITGFTAAYIGLLFLLTFLLSLTGLNLVTAFSAIVATLSNTGAMLANDPNFSFATLSATGHWICIVAMLAGRLEIFSLVILVTPAFWRN